MPEAKTLQRAKKDAAEGKSASTQAGEFVREEVEHIREGKHGARSTKQAIAIGLSKARRAGVKLPAPGRGTSRATRRKAAADARKGRAGKESRPSARRSRATERALEREGRSAGSRASLSRQARSAAAKRGASSRSASARAAARTRGRSRRR
ncbi:MAG TPA: DUF6496 domain-containing protein [Polyangia bacterium]